MDQCLGSLSPSLRIYLPDKQPVLLSLVSSASYMLLSPTYASSVLFFTKLICLLRRTTNTSLPSQATFWNRFKPKGKEPEPKQVPMAVARPRLLTLAYGDMETLRMVHLLPFLFFVAHPHLLIPRSSSSQTPSVCAKSSV